MEAQVAGEVVEREGRLLAGPRVGRCERRAEDQPVVPGEHQAGQREAQREGRSPAPADRARGARLQRQPREPRQGEQHVGVAHAGGQPEQETAGAERGHARPPAQAPAHTGEEQRERPRQRGHARGVRDLIDGERVEDRPEGQRRGGGQRGPGRQQRARGGEGAEHGQRGHQRIDPQSGGVAQGELGGGRQGRIERRVLGVEGAVLVEHPEAADEGQRVLGALLERARGGEPARRDVVAVRVRARERRHEVGPEQRGVQAEQRGEADAGRASRTSRARVIHRAHPARGW